jgi:plasmid stabilization system protein ParE
MAEFRLSPEAEADLDSVWLHIARESGSIEIATRVVDRIHDRFWLPATYPHI